MKRGSRILIAGCGRIGTQLGKTLVKEANTVWGLRRDIDLLPPEILPVQGDLAHGRGLASLPESLDYVFYSASSGSNRNEAYKAAYVDGVQNLLDQLLGQKQRIKHIFFISSTGVYPQLSGEWVDEDSPTDPSHAAGQYLLQGERLIHSSPWPATVIRLGGIYGPGRVRLLERIVQGREACLQERIQFTNLIHLADCVSILHHLWKLPNLSSCYLAVDCEPTDRCKMLHWLAKKLEAPEPRTLPSTAFSERQLRSNKRCRNRRLLHSGYKFLYPTFRDGYRSLIQQFGRARPHSISQKSGPGVP
jgi:nucleoside-diphosphate-sugar epimerase